MEYLPSEILLKVCSFLHTWEKNQLGLTCKALNFVVQESWQDFAVELGWKNESSLDWLSCCKKYMSNRKKWFTGCLSEEKIFFKDTLNSLLKNDKIIALSTNKCVYCYSVCQKRTSKNKISLINLFVHPIDVAEGILFLSDSFIGTVDTLTSEIVYFDVINLQQSRIQLNFHLNLDFCHCTDNHIILITDSGKIFLNNIGKPEVHLIHEDGDEVAHSYLHNDCVLFVSFWSGLFVALNLNKPEIPVLSMKLDLVFYSIKTSTKFIYFGSAEGDIGRIRCNNGNERSVQIFPKKHCDSVYCVSINKTILVSGGADSKVVFWSLQGEMLYCDSISHVGIVRHIFLNEWLMVTTGDAHVIIIWDPISRQLKHIMHHNPIKIKHIFVNDNSMVYGTPDSNYAILLTLK